MDINVYLPASYDAGKIHATPVLIYLAGLTCSPANGAEKAFFQPYADKYGFAVVYPDTSPRGAGIDGEDENWDFGTGAGFYCDATTEKYKDHYRMYSYINEELPVLLAEKFAGLDFDTVSLTGHSMGGYGALAIYLKNAGKYKSVSAFAPISNPSNCPWGEKCFGGYLGDDRAAWLEYDPTVLIKKYDGPVAPILIHQGLADAFHYRDNQLQPENFLKASEESKFKGKVSVNLVEKFDHSYFFIASFAKEHAEHHAKYLGLVGPSL
ncbi:hypothetical protein BABINDRAFT_159526 [Babjeviella inositovora NRRL Y-12698]|uniref:S-formylglutathione hydrolase n=1 Tax=Babjeviella inositovora NRRL Y-12698 TaxID=984486 RepID=A0A1E3QZT9_9ASCO|nr:uncharacterized protein BABINDRAFT_159526 [Babjeviella inositovora NRRL Y-12698]ODQ83064.1 hypothetical protein BABINDRAFT_159526 [Babjeviella inositovora NRRL Y-12698]